MKYMVMLIGMQQVALYSERYTGFLTVNGQNSINQLNKLSSSKKSSETVRILDSEEILPIEIAVLVP